MFAPPPIIETEVYATVPPDLRVAAQNLEWNAVMRHGAPTDCFLEGPAFDRDGNLFCVDIPFGRILKVDRDRKVSVFTRVEGEPCGLKIHRDGRIYVASQQGTVVVLKAGPAFTVLARNKLDGQVFVTPAILDGLIYLRTEQTLWVFGE